MQQTMHYKPHWVREDFVDFIAEKFNPSWAWKKVKAEVIDITEISPDFYQLQLRPNRNFNAQQFKAGQSVLLTLNIAGVRQQRSYSILNITRNGDLCIAVKRQGRVSEALTRLSRSAVLELSQSQGDFVLELGENAIVLIASGSGITAIYALLKDALSRQYQKIDLIYFSRDEAFHAQLTALAAQHPQFNYVQINTLQTRQHLSQALLQQYVPDFQQRTAYVCGAQGMMQAANQIYRELGIQTQLKQEFFQKLADENVTAQPVVFARSQQHFQAQSSLLESAEQAGLRPSHGCRMGICNRCSCTKISGSTKNLLTGVIDHDSQTQIKLCISQAVSPVVINL